MKFFVFLGLLLTLSLSFFFYQNFQHTSPPPSQKILFKGDSLISLVQKEDPLYTQASRILIELNESKLYFQLDKPLYRPGETLWFQTYFLYGSPTLRRVAPLSIEVVNPRGAVLETIRVSPKPGIYHSFLFPPDSVGGEYKLRLQGTKDNIHTERSVLLSTFQAPRFKKELDFLQESYVPGDSVSAVLSVHRDTGEAFANASFSYQVTFEGKVLFEKSQTCNEQGKALIRFDLPQDLGEGESALGITLQEGAFQEFYGKRIPVLQSNLQFALYPEGGTSLANYPNTYFFQAQTPTGKPAEVQGEVLNSEKQVLQTFSSYHRGFGKFTFTPKDQQAYHLRLTHPRSLQKTFPLPAFSPEALQLHLEENEKNIVAFNISSTKAYSPAYLLWSFQNEVLELFYPAKKKEKEFIGSPS
jgi:hypothetical protein